MHKHTYELVNLICSLIAMLALVFPRFRNLPILVEPVLFLVILFLVIHWRRGLIGKRRHLVLALSVHSF